MNAGFKEIIESNKFQMKFDCIVFHDVDLLPTDDLNLYTCPPRPRHMSILVDNYDYMKTYPILVGGVLNFPIKHFIQVNGYSNQYWGWGKVPSLNLKYL